MAFRKIFAGIYQGRDFFNPFFGFNRFEVIAFSLYNRQEFFLYGHC